MMTVPEILTEAKHTFEERGIVYGENYRKFGHVMVAMFPKGLELNTVDQWNRFGIFTQMISKVTRYSNDFLNGHIDSVHDLGVYSFMLESLDREAEEKFEQFCAKEIEAVTQAVVDPGNDHPPLPFPLPDPFGDIIIYKNGFPLYETKNTQVSKNNCPGHIYDDGVCLSCGAKKP